MNPIRDVLYLTIRIQREQESEYVTLICRLKIGLKISRRCGTGLYVLANYLLWWIMLKLQMFR